MDFLDNPVWASLRSRHARVALTHGAAARYPAAVAPFAAVDPGAPSAAADLALLVAPGETVLFVGPVPALHEGWQVSAPVAIAQMTCPGPIPTPSPGPGPGWVELGEQHRPDVLALTALVYPHYFRPRTPTMGRYIGIYEGGVLAALAGERMGTEAHQEISAVCTHPDYTGRGYAQRLVAELSNASHDAGRLPFLHVSPDNLRAKALYERLGYRWRRDIALREVARLQA